MINKYDHSEHNHLAEEKIKKDVIQYGWSIGLIEATEDEPAFGYTIGLWKTFNHPEIIAFGLTTAVLQIVLNNIAMQIKNGKIIEIEKDDLEIFEEMPAQFIPVDKKQMASYFGYAFWFNDYQEFPAIQLVWPDKERRFPWEVDFDKMFAQKQIILNISYQRKINQKQSAESGKHKNAEGRKKVNSNFKKFRAWWKST